jgi:hypothetical protein
VIEWQVDGRKSLKFPFPQEDTPMETRTVHFIIEDQVQKGKEKWRVETSLDMILQKKSETGTKDRQNVIINVKKIEKGTTKPKRTAAIVQLGFKGDSFNSKNGELTYKYALELQDPVVKGMVNVGGFETDDTPAPIADPAAAAPTTSAAAMVAADGSADPSDESESTQDTERQAESSACNLDNWVALI